MLHTIPDLVTWEQFEQELKRLQKRVRDPDRPEAMKFLFRGQEDSCWPVTTTLERRTDGRETSFQSYYEFIYQAKSEFESFTEENWDIPEPEKIECLTRNREPFASFTAREFRTWGQVASYMVHLRHHGFPSPFLDWTRSPYIAAFFAFRQPMKDMGKVSIFVYREMRNPRVYSSSRPEIHILRKPYSPMHRRHFLQQAEYTFCVQHKKGEHRKREWHFGPHERALGRGDSDIDVIWKFNLPATERLKVLKLLDRSNMNAFSLFQSEESLMETVAFRELDCHRLL